MTNFRTLIAAGAAVFYGFTAVELRAEVPDLTSYLEYVCDPSNARWGTGNAQARSVMDLQVYHDRIFPGMGNWDKNCGPVYAMAINPLIGACSNEYTMGTESCETIRVLTDGILSFPATDCREKDASAGYWFTRNEAGEWHTRTSSMVDSDLSTHIWDLIKFGDRLFAAGYGIASSKDGGTTWTDVNPAWKSKGERFVAFLVCGDELFARSQRSIPYDYKTGEVIVSQPGDLIYCPAIYHHWNKSTEQFDSITNSYLEMDAGLTRADFALAYASLDNKATTDGHLWHATPFKDRCLYILGCGTGMVLTSGNYTPVGTFPAAAFSAYSENGCLKGQRITLEEGAYPYDFTVNGETAYLLSFKYKAKKVEHAVWKSTDGVSFTKLFTFDYQQVMSSIEYYNGCFYFGVAYLNAQPLLGELESGITDKAGSVYRVTPPQSPVAWKGGAVDPLVSRKENWKDEASGEELTEDPMTRLPACIATFVEEGSSSVRAEINGPTCFYGVKFGNVGGDVGGVFTIAQAVVSTNAFFGLGYGGLTFLDPLDGSQIVRRFEIEPPLVLTTTAAQTWTVPTNVTLSLPGGIAGSANITVNGRGEIRLGASSDYAGQLSLYRINAFITGEIAKEGSSGKFTFTPNKNDAEYLFGNLTLSNAVFNVPVTLTSGGSTDKTRANSTTWYRTCDWTTNVYRKPVSLTGSGWIRGSLGSENVFGDKFSFTKTFVLGGGGEGGTTKATKQNPAVFRFQGPVISTYSAKLTDSQPYAGDFESLSNSGYVKVIFEHDGGVMRCGQLQANNGIVYEFRVDNVFGEGGARVFGTSGTYDLTSTTQNFGHPIAKAGGTGVAFTGTKGSCARFVDGWAINAETAAKTNINASVFAGALSLTFAPTNSTWLRIADSASTMSGAITVEGGTLELYGSTTFNNASEIKVLGGKLLTSAATSFSRNVAVTVAEGAKIEIPADKVLHVGPVRYNGTWLSTGEYTKSNSDFIEGNGTLYVHNPGMRFILK